MRFLYALGRPLGWLTGCMVLLAAASAAGQVRIPTDVPYGKDVEAWWAQHPLNPDRPDYDERIVSPPRREVLSPGESIDRAVAALPATGGTIVLRPGRYGAFHILKRSHVHIVAPRGAMVTGTSRLRGTALNYHDFARALRIERDANAIDDFENKKTRDILIRGVTFDGEGKDVYALVSDCVEGVLVDGCTFGNYIRHPKVPNHVGMAIGCMGTDSIWYRNCVFTCHRTRPPGNALYHDGIHAGGLIGCRIDRGFTGGGLLFLVNDDFTYDHDGDGRLGQDEIRMSEYVIIHGCTFAGGSHATRMSAANSMVHKCRAIGRFHRAFCYFNPKTSLIHTGSTYRCYGNRVIGNTVAEAAALAHFDVTADHIPAGQTNKARLGRYVVRDNRLGNVARVVRHTGSIDGPNVCRDNRRVAPPADGAGNAGCPRPSGPRMPPAFDPHAPRAGLAAGLFSDRPIGDQSLDQRSTYGLSASTSVPRRRSQPVRRRTESPWFTSASSCTEAGSKGSTPSVRSIIFPVASFPTRQPRATASSRSRVSLRVLSAAGSRRPRMGIPPCQDARPSTSATPARRMRDRTSPHSP